MRYHLYFACSLSVLLAACGQSAEITQKLETVHQCIDAPASIQQSFDLAIQEDRIPVYVTMDNETQYENTDWYQNNKTFYEEYDWSHEDWSKIADLSECRQALETIDAEFPKSAPVKSLRTFIDFNETMYKKYWEEQKFDASTHLWFLLDTAQNCLIIDHYPQAFEFNDYDLEREFLLGAFSISWDDDTTTADGRDVLLRPVKSVKDTGCMNELNTLSHSYIDWATYDNDTDFTWSDYAEYTDRFEEMTSEVDNYNKMVDEQHEALKASGETIPPIGPYAPPIIYKSGIEYFSDRDFNNLLKACAEAVPETWMNEAKGQLMTTTPSSCSAVRQLCYTEDIKPPLNKELCEPHIDK